jgi:hypothetical protein
MDGDGKAAFAGNTRFDCPAGTGAHAWEGCSFSVCNLPDGDYEFRFARAASAAPLAFSLQGGVLRLAPTPLAVQVGNYGIDATGSRVALNIDLNGYEGPWGLEAWPAPPFRGQDTHGRGTVSGGLVSLSVYPATPYALRFGDKPGAAVTVGLDGQPALVPAAKGAPPGPLRVSGGHLVLRTAQVTITPVDAKAAWHFAGGNTAHGPGTVKLPAGISLVLFDETHQETQSLALNGACAPTLAPATGRFTAAVQAGGCQR